MENEFSDRLRQVVDYYGLTSGVLADKLGIQRSTLSHLFSGRNKPGFDFLQKLHREFSDLDLNWMVSGEGRMLLSQSTPLPVQEEPVKIEAPEPTVQLTGLFDTQENETREPAVVPPASNTRKAVKVILLYSDGKFEEFTP